MDNKKNQKRHKKTLETAWKITASESKTAAEIINISTKIK
jgi:hypothetical protein